MKNWRFLLIPFLAFGIIAVFGRSQERGLDTVDEAVGKKHGWRSQSEANTTGTTRTAHATTHFVESGDSWGVRSCNEVYGISVADYDGDHDDDLYIGCHAEPPILYENNGATAFIDRTDNLALITNDNEYRDRHIAAFADYDGDDDLDLAIITGANFGNCCGHDQLYRNGPTPWQDQAAALGIRDSDGSGRYGLWFDYDNDTDLDLFVGHVVYPESPEKNHNLLYENSTWANVAAAVGLDYLDNSGTALAVDLDDDRDLDLVLTPKYARAGGEPEQDMKFYRNDVRGPGTFERIECAGTSDYVTVASGDVDGDGDPDLIFGRIGAPAEIWLNPGAAASPCTWTRRQLGVRSQDATAIVLADFDNDGDLDFYLGRQNQDGMAPAAVFLSNGDGTFSEDTTAGVALWSRSNEIQATWGDFNRDGWVDLVSGAPQVEGFRHVALLLNRYSADFPANRSLTLRLRYDREGSKNRSGIGARVRIEAGGQRWTRWIDSGGSWHASLAHYVHLGVGAAQEVDLHIDWPDGSTTSHSGLTTNDCWEVEYTSGNVRRCKPPIATSVTSDEVKPADFSLFANYPNPFNPSTVIGFQLPAASEVSLAIYSSTGQLVRQLARGTFASGRHQVAWDGKNDRGQRVASGIYFYQLTAENFRSIKRMMLLK